MNTQENNIKSNATTKMYLNNNFLDTAFYTKIPESKTEVSYLYFSEPGKDNDLSVKVEKIELTCQKLTLPKTHKNILVDTLIDMLYNKYYELALSNDKSFRKTTLSGKTNFITKWLKGNNDLILETSNQSIKKLTSKIIAYSNNIAFTSRLGAAEFIIINSKLADFIMDSPLFIFEDISKIREAHMIHSIGSIAGIRVFVNLESEENSILIGRNSKDTMTGGSVVILEHKKEVFNDIEWTGLISETSPATKNMFDIIRIQLVDDLPWYKKVVYYFSKKRSWING